MLRKCYAYILFAVFSGLLAGSAFAFQQTPVPHSVVPGVTGETAELLTEGDFQSEFATPNVIGSGSKDKSKSWFGLPTLNFGLELLYGEDSNVSEELIPDELNSDVNADFTIKGTVKKPF